MEMDAEKPTLNAFERFLYWFFIQIVFTAVLIGALLSLFDYNVMNGLLKAGHKVPGLSAVLPQAKGEAAQTAVKTEEAAAPDASADKEPETQVSDLKKQLEQKEQDLKAADDTIQQKDQELKDLGAKYSALEEEKKQEAQSDEEYAAKVKETASMYAKMSPSKAAPIMQNLTTAEQILLLSEMTLDQRVGILEKMDPAKAAEVSIALKDSTPARDKQIAALQERLSSNTKTKASTASSTMTKSDLGQTFANMTPKSAASLLIEMEKTTPGKVTEIMNSMDTSSRSKIMSAISDASKETAASITSRLAP